MATGNIKGGKRNYAKVTPPTTSTPTTNASTTTFTLAYTEDTLGPRATSYTVTAANTGITSTASITTSGGSIAGFNPGTYTLSIAGVNYNGTGPSTTISNSFVIPANYVLVGTYNSSTNYVVESGITKIAAYVIGGGGGGSGGGNGSGHGTGGGGGGGTGIAGFKDYAVTAGQTVVVTVGAGGTSVSGSNVANAGGASNVTVAGTSIATANGGNGALNASNNTGAGGAGGSGGTGSSNVAGAITISGPSGGEGRSGNSNNSSFNGANQASNSNITGEANISAILPTTTRFGSGGSGFGGPYSGGTGGGGGGSGNGQGSNGQGATGTGAGGGGGGGQSGTAGGAGAAGQIVLYKY
jgi:hypothetical protein